MSYKLPSEADQWIQEYRATLDESEEYTEVGQGWGEGFNGDFIFHIQPDDSYDGESVYLYLALEDGACEAAYVTDDPDGEEWGFAFRGGAADWKRLVTGNLGPVEGMMDGTFDLDGDMQKILQYSQAAVVMTELASDVDTEFEF